MSSLSEVKKCSMCKVEQELDKFISKKNGKETKKCLKCRDIMKKYIIKCEHGRQKHQCKECKGSGICEHGRHKHQCKECKGISICEHGRQKQRCKECKGSSFCNHGRRKSRCKICCDALVITIKYQLNNSKKFDIKHNIYDEDNFIDYDFCKNLLENITNCIYCGIEMQYKERKFNMATIERKDNSIGHIKSNCSLCCSYCNTKRIGQRKTLLKL